MGEIQNPRHERFAQELAAGNTADAAYEAAGYRKHRGNAARLSANEHVKERVREIQAIGAERAAVTVQSLIRLEKVDQHNTGTLRRYVEPLLAKPPNESELRVDLVNGSMIRLYGADNPDALRGPYLDDVVLDEFADMKPEVWHEVVRPMLADRRGWATFIGTPKSSGGSTKTQKAILSGSI